MEKEDKYTSVEISGRYCGKTTRLISQLATDFIRDNGSNRYYSIVVKNTMEKDDIRRKVYNVLEALTDRSRHDIMKKVKAHIFDNGLNFLRGWGGYRIYFDGFDRYKWDTRGVHNLRFNMQWAKSVYATTTPSYVRIDGDIRPDHDPILSFIKIAKGRYTNWYNEDLDATRFPTPEFVFREKYGIFILPKDREDLD